MTDFDAIVIGAGHNGLTAATLLQKAGRRTLCLDA
ncbi:NAD(P)-binding protein, partial [Mycolicibacterium pulveris]